MQLNRWNTFSVIVVSSILTAVVVGATMNTGVSTAQPLPVDQQIARLVSDQQSTRDALQRTQIMAVIYQVDGAGFHDLDEKLSGGTFVPGALGRVRRVRIAVDAVAWPHAMEEIAKHTADEMRALEAALRDENVQQAAGPASEVHELTHRLSDLVYSALAGTPAPAHDD